MSNDTTRVDKLAFYLLKAVNKALYRYRMLASGDRVLVAVSGGKDSLTLLDLLHRYQRYSREHYQLQAAMIRTDYHCGRTVTPEWLGTWCAERGIPFELEEIRVAEELAHLTGMSTCFRCAWLRRKALFGLAGRLGCNKIAFGHHADDIAETALMNLFYNARLQRMAPKMALFDGRLVVIRPLAFVEERDIVPFARASGFPIEGRPCPAGQDSRRALMKKLLREVEGDCHDVKRHIYRAVERYEIALQENGLSEEEHHA